MSKIFAANILIRLFTYKTKGTGQDGRPAIATSTTQNTPVLSTIFEISRVVYQLLRFNDGSLTAIRDDLVLCVSVCGKHNYLHNPDSNGKFNHSLSRNTKLFSLIDSTHFMYTAATYSRIEMGESLWEIKVHNRSS